MDVNSQISEVKEAVDFIFLPAVIYSAFDFQSKRRQALATICNELDRKHNIESSSSLYEIRPECSNESAGNLHSSLDDLLETSIRLQAQMKLGGDSNFNHRFLTKRDVIRLYQRKQMWQVADDCVNELITEMEAVVTKDFMIKHLLELQEIKAISGLVSFFFHLIRSEALANHGRVSINIVDTFVGEVSATPEVANCTGPLKSALTDWFTERLTQWPCEASSTPTLSWGHLVDFFKVSPITQMWSVQLTKHVHPRQMAILQLPFSVRDERQRNVCPKSDTLRGYKYHSSDISLITGSATVNAIQRIKCDIKLPVTLSQSSSRILSVSDCDVGSLLPQLRANRQRNSSSSSCQRLNCVEKLRRNILCATDVDITASVIETYARSTIKHGIVDYELPLAWEEVLSLFVSNSLGTNSLDLCKVDVAVCKALSQLMLGNIDSANFLLTGVDQTLLSIGLENDLAAVEFYKACALLKVHQCRSHVITCQQKGRSLALQWLQSNDGVRTLRDRVRDRKSVCPRQIERTKPIKDTLNKKTSDNKTRDAWESDAIENTTRKFIFDEIMNEFERQSAVEVIQIKSTLMQECFQFRMKVFDVLERGNGISWNYSTGEAAVRAATVLMLSGKFREARLWLSKSLRIMEKCSPIPDKVMALIQCRLLYVNYFDNRSNDVVEILGKLLIKSIDRCDALFAGVNKLSIRMETAVHSVLDILEPYVHMVSMIPSSGEYIAHGSHASMYLLKVVDLVKRYFGVCSEEYADILLLMCERSIIGGNELDVQALKTVHEIYAGCAATNRSLYVARVIESLENGTIKETARLVQNHLSNAKRTGTKFVWNEGFMESWFEHKKLLWEKQECFPDYLNEKSRYGIWIYGDDSVIESKRGEDTGLQHSVPLKAPSAKQNNSSMCVPQLPSPTGSETTAEDSDFCNKLPSFNEPIGEIEAKEAESSSQSTGVVHDEYKDENWEAPQDKDNSSVLPPENGAGDQPTDEIEYSKPMSFEDYMNSLQE